MPPQGSDAAEIERLQAKLEKSERARHKLRENIVRRDSEAGLSGCSGPDCRLPVPSYAMFVVALDCGWFWHEAVEGVGRPGRSSTARQVLTAVPPIISTKGTAKGARAQHP